MESYKEIKSEGQKPKKISKKYKLNIQGREQIMQTYFPNAQTQKSNQSYLKNNEGLSSKLLQIEKDDFQENQWQKKQLQKKPSNTDLNQNVNQLKLHKRYSEDIKTQDVTAHNFNDRYNQYLKNSPNNFQSYDTSKFVGGQQQQNTSSLSKQYRQSKKQKTQKLNIYLEATKELTQQAQQPLSVQKLNRPNKSSPHLEKLPEHFFQHPTENNNNNQIPTDISSHILDIQSNIVKDSSINNITTSSPKKKQQKNSHAMRLPSLQAVKKQEFKNSESHQQFSPQKNMQNKNMNTNSNSNHALDKNYNNFTIKQFHIAQKQQQQTSSNNNYMIQSSERNNSHRMQRRISESINNQHQKNENYMQSINYKSSGVKTSYPHPFNNNNNDDDDIVNTKKKIQDILAHRQDANTIISNFNSVDLQSQNNKEGKGHRTPSNYSNSNKYQNADFIKTGQNYLKRYLNSNNSNYQNIDKKQNIKNNVGLKPSNSRQTLNEITNKPDSKNISVSFSLINSTLDQNNNNNVQESQNNIKNNVSNDNIKIEEQGNNNNNNSKNKYKSKPLLSPQIPKTINSKPVYMYKNFNYLSETQKQSLGKKNSIRKSNKPTYKININYAYKTRAGQYTEHIRKVNQDGVFMVRRFMGDDNSYAFGVCDGHGQNGSLVSSFVKKVIPKSIHREIKRKYKDGWDDPKLDMEQVLFEAFNTTHQDLTCTSTDVGLSGTTAVSVIIKNGQLWCANCGDSRAILVRKQNLRDGYKIVELSEDHKPSLVREKYRIVKAGGVIRKQSDSYGNEYGCERVWQSGEELPGLAMTRSIGDLEARKAGVNSDCEVKQHTIDSNDMFIVIASDGVWEFMENEDVAKVVNPYYQSNSDPRKAADDLVKKALGTWQQRESSVDDITCIVIFIKAIDERKIDLNASNESLDDEDDNLQQYE